jgi:signal transduction histidine kinase/ligand-binding sensor domain-containing protein
MSSRSATCILQDRYGFLWLGTQNGLNRYDGISITSYTPRIGDTTALPDAMVQHIHEDKRGNLWVATAQGLSRFNRTRETFSTLLTGKSIYDIFEDSTGTVWAWSHVIGTNVDELFAIRFENAASAPLVTPFTVGGNVRSLYITTFCATKDGSAWFGTTNGILGYNRQSGKLITALGDAESGTIARQPRSRVNALAEMPEGVLRIGTDDGLASMSMQTQQAFQKSSSTVIDRRIDFTTLDNPAETAPKGGFVLFHQTPNRELWCGVMQAGARANANAVTFYKLVPSSGAASGAASGNHLTATRRTDVLAVVPLAGKTQLHRRAMYANGTLLWGVGNGLVRLDVTTGKASLLLTDPAQASRLSASVTGVIVDRAANAWCSRLNAGVERLVEVTKPFGFIPFSETITDKTLLSPRVSALFASRGGTVWVGYKNGSGLSAYNPARGTFQHFRQSASDPKSMLSFANETTVRGFTEDKSGRLWVAGYAAERLPAGASPASAGFTHVQVASGQVVPVTGIVETRDGVIWIGSKLGLHSFDPRTNVVEHFFTKANDNRTLGNNSIQDVYQDREGTLWIGHDGGLDRFDRTTKQFDHIRADAATPTLLSSPAVTTLFEDSKGRFWVGTRGGLNRFDRNTRTVTARYTQSVLAGDAGSLGKLPDNTVSAILEDAKGNLWISTRRGLCRFIPEKKTFMTYAGSDGIADIEFLDRSGTRLANGELWFGSASGITTVKPDSVIANLYAPPVVLSALKIMGLPVKTESDDPNQYIGAKQTVEFTYEDRVVAFEYVALNFVDSKKNQYAYKLDGFDNEWQYVGALREAKYTNLPAGSYTFRVKAANSDGLWNEANTAITVVVHPAWWATWWFRIGSLVLVGMFALWLYYQRVRSITERNLELERLVNVRTGELQMANEEVSRQLEMLNERSQEVELANTQLQETNETLDAANHEVERQLEILGAQAREIEMTNGQLEETNLELDLALEQTRNMQAQLVQSERLNAAGMLTAGVMHEINNPNASLSSAVELAQQKLNTIQDFFLSMLDDESRKSPVAERFVRMMLEVRESLTVAINGSERIRRIVTSLQGFTKHQHVGKMDQGVAMEIHATVEIFQYQFKKVEVAEEMDDSLHLTGDWGELNQAVLNLLVNAAQAEATRIKVIVEQEKDTITVCIEDNGKGMSDEVQRRIFEPFYTTKSVGNSGLGLSITKSIIERNAGTITVVSEVGKGTTFTITFPLQQQAM